MGFSTIVYILLLLPLIGGLTNGIFGKFLPKNLSGAIGTGAIFASFLCVLTLFNHVNSPLQIDLFNILQFDSFSLEINFLVDQLSVWMSLIITGIGTLIHLFSMGYMKEDEGYYKFFTYLNLFIFAMLLLVLGGNYFILFFGWEGVGICSFLLIGFHY
ncbi:MAG: NADH-quinone oxidoreductase subunit L, partial [Bacteroidota bacterium]